MKLKAFTLAGGFCGAWQGTSPNAVSEQSVDDCEPAIIQDGGFSVACNKVKCAKVTTKRNERNFFKKFLKWSYQVVTARKIQDEAFTLAEILITLAIIGVVAAISIPSVISNSQQQEFKTGLRKAVSVLNSAITMNMALDGETPYDNANTFAFLQRHMNTIKSGRLIDFYWAGGGVDGNIYSNMVFYTADGMRFEFFPGSNQNWHHVLYESNGKLKACIGSTTGSTDENGYCGGCGSYGLNSNSDKTTKTPCLIMVDVNGDKKPNPQNAMCKSNSCKAQNIYKESDPTGLKLTDLFLIMITDKEAIPWGIAAQRAMYQAQK